MSDVKVITTELNGRKVAIQMSMENNIPNAKVLDYYSDTCYETNVCDACKDDKSGKTCLNKPDSGMAKFLYYYKYELADDTDTFKADDYECRDVCEFVDDYLDNSGYTEHQKRFFDVQEFLNALINEDDYEIYKNMGDGYIGLDGNDISNDWWSAYMTKVVVYAKGTGNQTDTFICRSDYDELYIIKKIK